MRTYITYEYINIYVLFMHLRITTFPLITNSSDVNISCHKMSSCIVL